MHRISPDNEDRYAAFAAAMGADPAGNLSFGCNFYDAKYVRALHSALLTPLADWPWFDCITCATEIMAEPRTGPSMSRAALPHNPSRPVTTHAVCTRPAPPHHHHHCSYIPCEAQVWRARRLWRRHRPRGSRLEPSLQLRIRSAREARTPLQSRPPPPQASNRHRRTDHPSDPRPPATHATTPQKSLSRNLPLTHACVLAAPTSASVDAGSEQDGKRSLTLNRIPGRADAHGTTHGTNWGGDPLSGAALVGNLGARRYPAAWVGDTPGPHLPPDGYGPINQTIALFPETAAGHLWVAYSLDLGPYAATSLEQAHRRAELPCPRPVTTHAVCTCPPPPPPPPPRLLSYAAHRYADDAPPFDPRNAARYVRLMQFGVWSPVFRPQASTLHGGRLSWRRHRWPWLAPQAASEGLGLPHCPCEKRHSDATERLWPWHPRPHQQSSIPAASMAIVMQARRWQHGHAHLELPRASRNHPC